MTESFTARVTGNIWDGSKAYTSYSYPVLPTRDQVMKQAGGDFAFVCSIKLTRTTTEISRVRFAEVSR